MMRICHASYCRRDFFSELVAFVVGLMGGALSYSIWGIFLGLSMGILLMTCVKRLRFWYKMNSLLEDNAFRENHS